MDYGVSEKGYSSRGQGVGQGNWKVKNDLVPFDHMLRNLEALAPVTLGPGD